MVARDLSHYDNTVSILNILYNDSCILAYSLIFLTDDWWRYIDWVRFYISAVWHSQFKYMELSLNVEARVCY